MVYGVAAFNGVGSNVLMLLLRGVKVLSTEPLGAHWDEEMTNKEI